MAERTGLLRASMPFALRVVVIPPTFKIAPVSCFSVCNTLNICGIKKVPDVSIGDLVCGGADGTRTRDLRRDRPAF